MLYLTPALRRMLKKPLGNIHTAKQLVKRYAGKKIVAVGDASVVGLLKLGVRPHLAVFDFLCKRKKVDSETKKTLRNAFGMVREIKNAAGTLSDELIVAAPALLEEGGGVKIDGEEDLTALVFIRFATDDMVVVYGQPDEGLVAVEGNRKNREKAEKIIEKMKEG